MKRFNFKYTKLVIGLFALVMALCTAGLVWDIINLVKFAPLSVGNTVVSVLILLFNVFVLFTATFMLFNGCYKVGEDCVRCCFGYVVSKYKTEDISEAKLFGKLNKLVIYFKDATFTVIIIDDKKYDEFVSLLREKNNSIIYTVE